MIQTVRVRRRITAALVIASAVAWVILLNQYHGSTTNLHAYHGSQAGVVSADKLLVWSLMLFAMMAPTLTAPLLHVWDRSFKRARASLMAQFVASYLAVWMLAGVAILHIIGLPPLASQRSAVAALMILLITIIWQCSPLKQRCLNRNHNHSALRAFGWAAHFDVVRFGIRHGFWCVGSCWSLMLFPMVLNKGHVVAMAVVTIIMVTEKLAPPSTPRWRIRGYETVTAALRQRIRGRFNTFGRQQYLAKNTG